MLLNLTLFSYVLSGIAIYGVYRLFKNREILWAGMAMAGSLSYLLLDLLRIYAGDPLMLKWPGWFSGLMGALCGLIIWGVLKLNLFRHQGFRAISTLTMGLSHALFCFLFWGLLIHLRMIETTLTHSLSFLHFLLIGFLSMFGFTFLQRKERI